MKTKIHLAITIAVMILIFIHSAMPGEMSGAESNFVAKMIAALTGIAPEALDHFVRKAAHFTEYFILGICLLRNVRDHKPEPFTWKLLMIPWVIAAFYACTDEFHQAFVPGRACSIWDVGIDSAGAAAGILLAWRAARRKSDDVD